MTHSSHTSTGRLDEIEARANSATTGPWSHCLDELRNRTAVHRIGSSEVNADVAFTYRDRDGRGPGMQDAEFIAHARADVPDLVGALQVVLDLCDSTTLECRPGDGSQPYMVVPADAVKAAIEAALEEARP